MKNDKGDDSVFLNLTLITAFCKYGADDFFKNVHNFVQEEVRNTFKTLFEKYFAFLIDRQEKRYSKLRALEKEIAIAKVTKGTVQEAKVTQLNAMKDSYAVLVSQMAILSEILGKKLPDLPMNEFSVKELLDEVGLNSTLVVMSQSRESQMGFLFVLL